MKHTIAAKLPDASHHRPGRRAAGIAMLGVPGAIVLAGWPAAPARADMPSVIVLNSGDASLSLIDQATFKETGRIA